MNTSWELWVINLGTLSTFVGTAATLWVLLQTSRLTIKFNRKASIYFHKEKLSKLLNDYYKHLSEVHNKNTFHEEMHRRKLHSRIQSLHHYILFIDSKDKKLTSSIKQYKIKTTKITSIKDHHDLDISLCFDMLDEVNLLLNYIDNIIDISARKIWGKTNEPNRTQSHI
nr:MULTISPECIES: hypothetical protein [unclassified Providencia]